MHIVDATNNLRFLNLTQTLHRIFILAGRNGAAAFRSVCCCCLMLLLCGLLCISNLTAQAQTPNVITYQGRLTDANAPANGQYDLRFSVYPQDVGGAQQGSIVTLEDVLVANGVFTVQLNFGTAPFINSTALFIETAIRPGASSGAFTLLSPRQPLTATPYALKAINAETATTATNATSLDNVAASQYVQTTDARLTDARPPVAGSASYIQNSLSQQSGSNFNITGNGTVGGSLSGNTVNSETQYNIGGSRVLTVSGIVGGNIFAGSNAGNLTLTGNNNSFFGRDAGRSVTAGHDNSFVGEGAGFSNTTGNENSFLGEGVGFNNTTGNRNSFFGITAGYYNSTGGFNSFFGSEAGSGNKTGSVNSFFGRNAGNSNETGSFNTIIGSNADVGAVNLDHATAIGADSVVSTSNTVVLGRATDKVKVPGNLIVSTLGAAGNTSLCRNASNEISTCSSSLRYKTGIAPFNFGLNILKRLRPITFTWKDGGMIDLGLGAEDVAAIEPLLVTRNAMGEVEGVKYDRIGVVLINAVKEQQAQISQQQMQIEQLRQDRQEQQRVLAGLRQLVCQSKSQAKVCR
jgi:hypothetical protein